MLNLISLWKRVSFIIILLSILWVSISIIYTIKLGTGFYNLLVPLLTNTETCQKYSVTVIFFYVFPGTISIIVPDISYKTTFFQSVIPKSSTVEAQILNIHDLSTNLNYVFKCTIIHVFNFWRSKFSFVSQLNRELVKIIDYKLC